MFIRLAVLVFFFFTYWMRWRSIKQSLHEKTIISGGRGAGGIPKVPLTCGKKKFAEAGQGGEIQKQKQGSSIFLENVYPRKDFLYFK